MSDLDEHRRHRYAVHTLALRDGTVPWAASLFDTALTNGLLVIVASEWPGQELRSKGGKTKSATELIELIITKIGSNRWLVAEFDFGSFPSLAHDEPVTRVEIDLGGLSRALLVTQPIRHGREGGAEIVSNEAVEALRDLDWHRALGVLTDAHIDQAEIATALATAAERIRVAAYIDLVGEQEIADCATRANEALPFDPKERYGSFDPDWCAMCGQKSLIVSNVLEYGSATGTCFACSYVVTEDMVADEEFGAMLRYHEHE